jgi:hypothetical protein
MEPDLIVTGLILAGWVIGFGAGFGAALLMAIHKSEPASQYFKVEE